LRERESGRGRAEAKSRRCESRTSNGRRIYTALRQKDGGGAGAIRSATASGSWQLHMHPRGHHDCSIDPQKLVDDAESERLARIARQRPNDVRRLGRSSRWGLRGADVSSVIPGEEVKTDDQGEVDGLFLSSAEIPRG